LDSCRSFLTCSPSIDLLWGTYCRSPDHCESISAGTAGTESEKAIRIIPSQPSSLAHYDFSLALRYHHRRLVTSTARWHRG
jgi:hypothetical protein